MLLLLFVPTLLSCNINYYFLTPNILSLFNELNFFIVTYNIRLIAIKYSRDFWF